MNRNDLAKALVAADNFKTQKDAEAAINAVTNAVAKALSTGDSVELYGFGKFITAVQKGKSGTVPGTTKTYTTQDKMVPRFSASKALKDAVAGK